MALRAGTLTLAVFFTFVVAIAPTTPVKAQQPDTETALKGAQDTFNDRAIADEFKSALERSRLQQLPDTGGLMHWLESMPTEKTDLSGLLEGKDRLLEQTTDNNTRRYESQVYVFVSFSMPEIALRNLYTAATPKNIPLVLRGFVGVSKGSTPSLGATQQRLFDVFGEALKKGGGILIDPTLYRRFDIRQVPAFVATTETPKACDQNNCEAPENYQLFGDVTLEFALGRLARTVLGVGE